MTNNAEIKSIKLDNISINFNVENSESFKLEISTESRMLPPKIKDDKTALYVIKAKIITPDSDQININATAKIVFEFDEIPTNYDEAGQKLCLKQSQVLIFDKIGEIMETMGYQRFEIEIPE